MNYINGAIPTARIKTDLYSSLDPFRLGSGWILMLIPHRCQ